MSISKKGRRKILVNQELYYWKVKRRPNYWQETFSDLAFSVTVEKASTKELLLVHCKGDRLDNSIGKNKRVITPKHVQKFINRAIELGWTESSSRMPLVEKSRGKLEISKKPI